ncbi:MAG: transglycosylase SLT domain-containing protein [Pseudomonadota bacterium]
MIVDALSGLKSGVESKQSITTSIRQAAKSAGIDFGLMLGVAQRESSLDASAKAKTSSASGLFQFIDQTWLGAVKQYGAELGLGAYADDIQRGERGYEVADKARRDEILNLRFNPQVAAKVAGKTLAAAKDRLTHALGREATSSEVYMAHFLGERGAIRMLQSGDQAIASDINPRAASANQTLFFQNGRALSVGEFKDKLSLKLGTEPASTDPVRPTEIPGPYRPAPQIKVDNYAQPTRPGFTNVVNTLPPQLQAAIVEMQADFILGRTDR